MTHFWHCSDPLVMALNCIYSLFIRASICCEINFFSHYIKVWLKISINVSTILDPPPQLLRGRGLETRVGTEVVDARVMVEVGGGAEGPPRTHHHLLGHASCHGINHLSLSYVVTK